MARIWPGYGHISVISIVVIFHIENILITALQACMGVLLSYSATTIASHVSIILIITLNLHI
tara:strand:+ start:188 stop:373 length:186 start_codon:yes stop_codon:yes gene_type:complete